ncbi:hypothetical protein DZ936_026500, partial [Pseudomonas aeruginosa]|nr:hypothetical protein [Pseudomonas aeruginosa]
MSFPLRPLTRWLLPPPACLLCAARSDQPPRPLCRACAADLLLENPRFRAGYD